MNTRSVGVRSAAALLGIGVLVATAAPMGWGQFPSTSSVASGSTDAAVDSMLALSPGATREEVVALISTFVADSAEDGQTPLTFDQAAEILLDYAQKSVDVQPEEISGPTPSGPSCAWAVRVQGKALYVTRGGVMSTLSVDASRSDDSATQFSGTVEGKPATAKVWLGQSERSVQAQLAQSERESEELLKASLDGAVDGEAPPPVTETFSSLPAPHDLVPVMYRLAVGNQIEAGVPVVGRGEAPTKAVPSADCASWDAANDEGRAVNVPGGVFFVPSLRPHP